MSTLNKTVYLFIDAANSWEVQKAKGAFFDYQKVVSMIKKNFNKSNVEVFYYTAYPKEGTRNFDVRRKHNFFTFLKKALGFNIRKKELKRIRAVDENGEYIKEKGDMDVEITIDAVHHLEKYSTAIFFTGDSDFLSLIRYIRNKGKKVFIFSSRNNVSNELRTGSDGYFDCLNLEEDIWGHKIKHRKK